jgi:tetraacyldisaccharide 4'-kinase
VKLGTPRWWYVRDGAPAPMTRGLLRPLSWAWAAVTARRIARTVPVDPGVAVICVGNLTVGGAGKTPVVMAVLERLTAMGVAGHALSRGYGGVEPGPLRVDPARHTAAQVGDEPLMMAAAVPAWVARDRAAGARAAAAAGAQVVVMDDGHQNPTVRKTLSLVVVDGETRGDEWPFGDGAVFPSGPMREPLAVGLARADAVVLMLPLDLTTPDPELLGRCGQALEGRTQPESRRLRPRRLREFPRSRPLQRGGPHRPGPPGAGPRRRPRHHRKGLGAPAPRLARARHRLARAGQVRRRGRAG